MIGSSEEAQSTAKNSFKNVHASKRYHQSSNASDQQQETESHQYEQDESEVWWHHQLQR